MGKHVECTHPVFVWFIENTEVISHKSDITQGSLKCAKCVIQNLKKKIRFLILDSKIIITSWRKHIQNKRKASKDFRRGTLLRSYWLLRQSTQWYAISHYTYRKLFALNRDILFLFLSFLRFSSRGMITSILSLLATLIGLSSILSILATKGYICNDRPTPVQHDMIILENWIVHIPGVQVFIYFKASC